MADFDVQYGVVNCTFEFPAGWTVEHNAVADVYRTAFKVPALVERPGSPHIRPQTDESRLPGV
jgi:hypothetical protein